MDAAEDLFEDERMAADEAAVDEAIRGAGGERPAIRTLLVQLDEASAAAAQASFGYMRGQQPSRPLT
jgi:hypothetical protein